MLVKTKDDQAVEVFVVSDKLTGKASQESVKADASKRQKIQATVDRLIITRSPGMKPE